MTLIHARHPVPMVLRPRRGRAYSQTNSVVTPVEIPEARADAFDEILVLPEDGPAYHAHEGALWIRPRVDDGFATMADLERYLRGEGREPFRDVDHLRASLLRTPFRPLEGYSSDTGYAFDPNPAHALVLDGRGPGAEGMRSLVAREMRQVGDAVYLRATGPLVTFSHETGMAYTFPRAQWADTVDDPAVRLDRADEVRAFLKDAPRRTRGAPNSVGAGLVRLENLRGIPSTLLADDDIDLMANRLPTRIDSFANEYARKSKDPARKSRLEAVGEAFSLRRFEGAYGMFSGEAAAAFLRECADALAAVVAVRDEARADGEGWAKAAARGPGPRQREISEFLGSEPPRPDGYLAQLRVLHLPRCEPAPAPEDEEAMEGLGPRP